MLAALRSIASRIFTPHIPLSVYEALVARHQKYEELVGTYTAKAEEHFEAQDALVEALRERLRQSMPKERAIQLLEDSLSHPAAAGWAALRLQRVPHDAAAVAMASQVYIDYTNYRGERSVRLSRNQEAVQGEVPRAAAPQRERAARRILGARPRWLRRGARRTGALNASALQRRQPCQAMPCGTCSALFAVPSKHVALTEPPM